MRGVSWAWWRTACLATLAIVGTSCSRPAPSADAALVPVTQAVGTWEGSGDHTIGFASTSGRFRIRWETRLEPDHTDGRFHVAVHSAVSGRPLQDVVDQQGPGSGTVNFEDDPRPYNLMVTSSGLDWSITVDEVVLVKP